MKKLLIITGPQGSGNHIFSRLFSFHESVYGWSDLQSQYWIPSDMEPFSKYMINPEMLSEFDFSKYDYYVANVSVPFVYNGVKTVPKIDAFATYAQDLGLDVSIGIIVRDQNINKLQQKRVRGGETLHIATNYYEQLIDQFDTHYIDHEAFFLYKRNYLKYLSKLLNFPIDYDNRNLLQFIKEDANSKYVQYVEKYWLDEQVWEGLRTKREREERVANKLRGYSE